ncbi:MAG: hypothetical protein CR217_17500 [Beijerinckiaceae bacterium]|nr:MAG: hypothetical protein CR217_17500 [Beijerinckiaceae bacterium]
MVHLELLYKPAAIIRGKPDGRLVVEARVYRIAVNDVSPQRKGRPDRGTIGGSSADRDYRMSKYENAR